MRYIIIANLILISVSCSKVFNDTESVGLLALLGYRQLVSIGGTFVGNYDADVRAYPLSVDGKCNRDESTMGRGSVDESGNFRITYRRLSQQGSYVCIIATPKPDGSSRFLDLTTQTRLPWTGDGFSVLVLQEPSTTTRSRFNVSATMFNRMALQKLEAQASSNKDPNRIRDLLRSSNKQVVAQFGLSRGLGRRNSSPSVAEIFLKGFLRESSVEAAIPDLNDIKIDFDKKDDPVTLKFKIVIGGIQKLADPNDPTSFDRVVNLVSELVAGTRTTATFPGGASVGAGQSFGTVLAQKVSSFVTEQAGSLGISQEQIAAIQSEVTALAEAIDNPPLKPPDTPSLPISDTLYPSTTTILKLGEQVSISPTAMGYSNFQIVELCISNPSLETFCEPYSFSDSLNINASSGLITVKYPSNSLGTITVLLKIKASKSGADTTGVVTLSLQGKPGLIFPDTEFLCTSDEGTTTTQCSTEQQVNVFYFVYTGGTQTIQWTPTIFGPFTSLTSTGFPATLSFNTSTGAITGSIINEFTAKITIVNSIGPNNYFIKVSFPKDTTFSSCLDAYQKGKYENKIYTIKLNDGTIFDGYCLNSPTMSLSAGGQESGGWLLILNYVHRGGSTNPGITKYLTTSLPILSSDCGGDPGLCSSQLGQDQSQSQLYWGHAVPELLNKISFSEVMFYGTTSWSETEVVHFKTSHLGTINYARTGNGSMSGIQANFQAYSTHNSNIPIDLGSFFEGQGDNALTYFPFYINGNSHWGIGWGNGSRYEVGRQPQGNGYDTIHRMYVR